MAGAARPGYISRKGKARGLQIADDPALRARVRHLEARLASAQRENEVLREARNRALGLAAWGGRRVDSASS